MRIYIEILFREMLKELGSGCFGTVYKARYKGEIIAAKKLKVTSRNEFDIAAEILHFWRLDHQNIVCFIDYHFDETEEEENDIFLICFIYMEFMEGEWLKLTN